LQGADGIGVSKVGEVVDAFAEMHHLVTRGYQQNFADDQKRVAVIDARSGKVIDPARPIKTNFVLAGYTAHVTPDGKAVSRLEQEFGRLERPVVDQIRRITPDNCGPKQRGAVATLFALHLVRSHAFRERHLEVTEQLRREWIPEVASSPEISDRYAAEFGRPPTAEDIFQFAERILDENVRANRFHVDGMVQQYNNIAERLSRLWVQVITADRRMGVGFALADIPVVHANLKTRKYGFRDGVAIGDADLIVGPLTRWTAVAFSVRREPPVTISVKGRLQEFNALFARAALSEIACHPDDARELARVCQRVDQLSLRHLFGV
jgi:hypothetical protein